MKIISPQRLRLVCKTIYLLNSGDEYNEAHLSQILRLVCKAMEIEKNSNNPTIVKDRSLKGLFISEGTTSFMLPLTSAYLVFF
jgi:hypothetical protein